MLHCFAPQAKGAENNCEYVCVSACLTSRISRSLRGETSLNFLCILTVVMAQTSDGVAICYVLPVLRLTSHSHTIGSMAHTAYS